MTQEKIVDSEFEPLLEYIKSNRGFDFTAYKRTSLLRRIRKRMSSARYQSVADYIDYLQVDADEFNRLFDTVLINVTAFFRDPECWQHIASEVVPAIVRSKGPAEQIRIWSAGCASGEEPYSIAILFAEQLGMKAFQQRVKVYATDVDEQALVQGRAAIYSAEQLGFVAADLKEKYFQHTKDGWAVRSELRRRVIFGRNDLTHDPPISRIDLLICRNTLMYFVAAAQARILRHFYFALQDRGFLFAGKAELLLAPPTLFSSEALKLRIFRKIPGLAPAQAAESLIGSSASAGADSKTLWMDVFDALPAAQLIFDASGLLLFANQNARVMFNLVLTDIGKPLQELELSYRPVELRSLVDSVNKTGKSEFVNKAIRHLPDGKIQCLDIRLDPLVNSRALSISFTDATAAEKLKDDFYRTLQELETTNEELHSTQEELETTNEELQSTNEELETTNEELQSTNEELETMNEELSSTNDELEASNIQLRALSVDSNRINSLLAAILSSIRTAIIVVDTKLSVLVWNKYCEELWGLRSDEVVGKALDSLDINLPLELLVAKVNECLKNKAPSEPFAIDSMNRRGRKFHATLNLSPIQAAHQEATEAALISIDEQAAT